MEQEAKVKRKKYEELVEKNEKRERLSAREIDQLDREMGQIEFWMKDKMKERWTMGGWVKDLDKDPQFTNTTFLPCQGGCMPVVVELHSEGGSDNSKLVVKKDCYHQGGNSYTCANCYEKKKPNDNPQKNQAAVSEILAYFKKHNIHSITLSNNKLLIKYHDKEQEQEQEANTQELQAIKSYAESLGKSELTLQDLEQSTSQTPKSDKLLYWGLGIAGVLVVGVVVWLVVKNNKKK